MTLRSPARRALFAPLSNTHDPVPQMNTTPLIDVLLVLLVILIITIPVQSHKVPLDLPQPGVASTPPVTQRLSVLADGTLRWNSSPLAEAALRAKLTALAADPAQLLLMDVDGETPYALFDATLATVKAAGVTRLGFTGNERWRDL